MSGLIDRLRRRGRFAMAAEPLRCSFCPSLAVSRHVPVAGGEETRRCMEHPPAALAGVVAQGERCTRCGRGFWPDFLHLDCPPRNAAG